MSDNKRRAPTPPPVHDTKRPRLETPAVYQPSGYFDLSRARELYQTFSHEFSGDVRVYVPPPIIQRMMNEASGVRYSTPP